MKLETENKQRRAVFLVSAAVTVKGKNQGFALLFTESII